ncbi:GbsR/MarR family transcriptional regulator [Arsenicicoccus sp. oral taxon 190]|uniref:GbsR/MarR family transcriptional regulator n=1 Tax=Arsenicicoccus sp. oral taxon 190 TaxID=1658671 RepID=UPI000679F9C2|nr:MarR family transcriptional regulator [Arsenicicoccus sp. oral taxon 190]AKT50639.1 hypothetical protein ADJ73_03745 [Arsenicicoccus sp. oral taxon 190]
MSSEDADRHAFVDRMGDLGAASGMPRMASRLLAHLFTVDEARATAAELGEALEASPAAISGAVRYLESLELVRRTRERGSRRDVFVLEQHVWSEFMLRSLDVVRVWGTVFGQGAGAVPGGPARDRLAENAAFFDFLGDELDASLHRWRQQGSDRDAERRDRDDQRGDQDGQRGSASI